MRYVVTHQPWCASSGSGRFLEGRCVCPAEETQAVIDDGDRRLDLVKRVVDRFGYAHSSLHDAEEFMTAVHDAVYGDLR